ncbi:MAG: CHAT domain-containing protein [Pleurocapsa sp. MO_226.B13]|nr:CHAT domain-containing protein [Pleurocapsa sp. MO_226.B13]
MTTKTIAISTVDLVKNDRHTIQLIERAKQLYRQEQYSAASQVWQQLATAYRQQRDFLNQAMALSNLALTQQKSGDLTAAKSAIASSLKLLSTQSQTVNQQRVLANSLDIQGSIARSQGQSKKAWETWQQAGQIYQQLDLDNDDAIIKNQINQAQALQDLGYYRRASKILTSVQTKLSNKPDSKSKIAALLSFANTLRVTGNLEQSQVVLLEAESIAKKLEVDSSPILLSLGNTVRAFGNRVSNSQTIQEIDLASSQCLAQNNSQSANDYYLQAIDCYRQATLSNDLVIQTKAQLNLLSLITQNQDIVSSLQPNKLGKRELTEVIPSSIADINTNLAQLPVNRTTIYDRLNLVQSLICLQPNTIKFSSPIVQQCPASSPEDLKISWSEIEAEINTARQQAQQIQDKPAQAYALGYLGAVYQHTGRLKQARQLTERALLTLDNNAAPEIAYLWQWQLGRISRLQNQPELALQAYNATFASLQSLRSDLVAINPETQFAFRDRLEPVYRERSALLLGNNPSQENLRQARDTIEALQLAELNNFFREACIDAEPQQIEQIDPEAAVIYSIILPDRLAVILSQPGQPLHYHQIALDHPQVIDRTFEDLYANLSPFLVTENPLQANQTFYDWLIRPLESQLQQHQTNTIVFILDGIMRGIPVASLYDGKQYLVEKYNLALTPGLQLLTSGSFASDTLKAVAGGLTESRQGFTSLPNVDNEVREIATLVPSEILLDRDFTRDRIKAQVTTQPFPIVHLATHGQFSSRAEDTFLLTWDDRINVRDLDQLLQARDFAEDIPIELLILSACQTATGDKQAALGLAGVAVRSGARSTLATLWSIQDDSTAELMTQFYRALQTPEITKAKALREAQLKLLRNPRYQHPFYWSAFVLVGNWL